MKRKNGGKTVLSARSREFRQAGEEGSERVLCAQGDLFAPQDLVPDLFLQGRKDAEVDVHWLKPALQGVSQVMKEGPHGRFPWPLGERLPEEQGGHVEGRDAPHGGAFHVPLHAGE